MDYVSFGRTGLKVSRLCLGCMTYGDPRRGTHEWTLPEDEARPFIKRALDHGINFFDTANVYSDGSSEEILGRALRDMAPRGELVIATKVHGPMRPKDPNGRGLSRKAILGEIDNSLKRLGMDYVDLYQIHRFDRETPIEETLEALHDVVKSGKARYIGASSMAAWQFAKANHLARLHGWTRFVSMQNHVNLLYREEEREMIPYCQEDGIAVIPWSPLARGRLTRPAADYATTRRADTDAFGKTLYTGAEQSDQAIIAAVERIAKARGVPMAEVALAWLLAQPGITAPIIGASKPRHLEDAIAALQLRLTPEETQALEAPYVPHAVSGFDTAPRN
jgi:aryl-alcohol dehydrogenase-like predicted oxidoreductase